MASVIETVVFTLREGVSKAQFLDAVAASTAFVRAQPGFVHRRLSTNDATWIDTLEWTSLAEAQAAAETLMATPSVQPFLACIDPSSIAMHHTTVELTVA